MLQIITTECLFRTVLLEFYIYNFDLKDLNAQPFLLTQYILFMYCQISEASLTSNSQI